MLRIQRTQLKHGQKTRIDISQKKAKKQMEISLTSLVTTEMTHN